MLAWLQKQWDDPCISLPDLYQFGPNPVRDLKTARDVVRGLENHGWLVPVETSVEIKGKRRREAWRIVGKEQALV